MYTNTISARELQTSYKKVFKKAQDSNEPIIVITNNKPVGAIVSMSFLQKYDMDRLNELVREAQAEYKAGKTKSIRTKEELEKDLKEMRDEALK